MATSIQQRYAARMDHETVKRMTSAEVLQRCKLPRNDLARAMELFDEICRADKSAYLEMSSGRAVIMRHTDSGDIVIVQDQPPEAIARAWLSVCG